MVDILGNNLKAKSNMEIGGVLFIIEDVSYTNTLEKRNFNRKSCWNYCFLPRFDI